MFSIRRASEADCALIRRLAGEVFPATYREILAPIIGKTKCAGIQNQMRLFVG